MRFVDAHCHLDQYSDPEAEAGACDSSQTYTIAVTSLPSSFAKAERIAGGRKFVRAAAGLHPELVARHPHAVEELLTLIERSKYIGEVGLDYTQAAGEDRQHQRRVLERIIDRCEARGGRVITMHSRRAAEDVLDVIGGVTRSTIILHWFSGSAKAAARGVAARCFFSVNPAMTRSVSGQSIITAIPDDRLLTETDGPFVKHAGRPVHPCEMASYLPAFAKVRNQTSQELCTIILRNFRRAVMLES